LSDQIGAVFSALADPTRRWMVQTLIDEQTASVPSLSAQLPITRQAVAKHLTALDEAGLIERVSSSGREVSYRLRPGALTAATRWMDAAESAWSTRLRRLKRSVEGA
jgi:DNA-binding transcriptional ArsR family regulator